MTDQSQLSIPYPWQQSHWHSFLQQLEQSRLVHSFLLSGPAGLGKAHYADAMANYLLCQHPRSELACGQCRTCRLNQAQTHPDKIVISPEASGKLIKIDQIRVLDEFISSTSQQGGRKVVVIGPVEQLNLNAANALLKNLEEPTAETFFILYTHVSSGVIATIRSRCQLVSMSIPKSSQTLQWLSDLGHKHDVDLAMLINANAPITSRVLLEDNERMVQLLGFIDYLITLKPDSGGDRAPDLEIVQHWMGIDLYTLLAWWLQLIYQSIRNEVNSDVHCKSPSLMQLLNLISHTNRLWLFRFIDKLLLAKKQYIKGANNNKQLLLEELVLDWCAIMKTVR